jgi:hypothetical protein
VPNTIKLEKYNTLLSGRLNRLVALLIVLGVGIIALSLFLSDDADFVNGNHKKWVSKFVLIALAQGLVTAGTVYFFSKPLENRLANAAVEASVNRVVTEALVPIRSELFSHAYYNYRCHIFVPPR